MAAHGFPSSKRLGAGVIDGRGIWADEGRALRLLASLRERLGDGQPISVQVRRRLGERRVLRPPFCAELPSN